MTNGCFRQSQTLNSVFYILGDVETAFILLSHDGRPSSDTISYWSSERSSYQLTPRLNQSSTGENFSVSETTTGWVSAGINHQRSDGNVFELNKKEQNSALPQAHGWLICLDPLGSVWVPRWWWSLESGPAARVGHLAETPWGPEASGQQVSENSELLVW